MLGRKKYQSLFRRNVLSNVHELLAEKSVFFVKVEAYIFFKSEFLEKSFNVFVHFTSVSLSSSHCHVRIINFSTKLNIDEKCGFE